MKPQKTQKGKLESKGTNLQKRNNWWQQDTNCKKKYTIARGPSNLCPEDVKQLATQAKAIYSTAKTTSKLEKVRKRGKTYKS